MGHPNVPVTGARVSSLKKEVQSPKDRKPTIAPPQSLPDRPAFIDRRSGRNHSTIGRIRRPRTVCRIGARTGPPHRYRRPGNSQARSSYDSGLFRPSALPATDRRRDRNDSMWVIVTLQIQALLRIKRCSDNACRRGVHWPKKGNLGGNL